MAFFQVLVGHHGGDGAISGGVGDLAHRLGPDVPYGEEAGHGGLHALVREEEAQLVVVEARAALAAARRGGRLPESQYREAKREVEALIGDLRAAGVDARLAA